MNKSRGDAMSKTKLDLLEIYAMQMEGKLPFDNKMINEITTSASEDMSESEDFF